MKPVMGQVVQNCLLGRVNYEVLLSLSISFFEAVKGDQGGESLRKE